MGKNDTLNDDTLSDIIAGAAVGETLTSVGGVPPLPTTLISVNAGATEDHDGPEENIHNMDDLVSIDTERPEIVDADVEEETEDIEDIDDEDSGSKLLNFYGEHKSKVNVAGAVLTAVLTILLARAIVRRAA